MDSSSSVSVIRSFNPAVTLRSSSVSSLGTACTATSTTAMGHRHRLHIKARAVLAPATRVVGLAVDEVEEPITVDTTDVAGVVPPSSGGPPPSPGAVPVALEHHVRTLRPGDRPRGGRSLGRTVVAMTVRSGRWTRANSAPLVAWWASDEAAHVTGQVVRTIEDRMVWMEGWKERRVVSSGPRRGRPPSLDRSWQRSCSRRVRPAACGSERAAPSCQAIGRR